MTKAGWGRATGFTMVELVVTLLLLGILAAIALPRFQDDSALTQQGFADEVRAALRYAQKLAIAKRREVCVDFVPAGGGQPDRLRLTLNPTMVRGAPCDSVVNLPGQADPYVVNAPRGVMLGMSPMSFRFNGLGQPVNSSGQPMLASVPVTVTGRALPITVSAETGHVLN